MPGEITARLATVIAAIYRDPAFIALAQRTQQPLRFLDQAAYAAHLNEANARFRALWAARPWL